MQYISQLSSKTKPWLLLAFSALAFELCALFFQYVLDLAPCIMCVYQRLAILSIVVAGFIGAAGHNFLLFRLIAFVLWAVGAIWGLIIALEHVEMQSATLSFFFSCEITPNFPRWAPLHEWLPALFEASGDCGKVSWEFFDYSMPQWMIAVYAAYTLAFSIIFLARLIHTRRL